MLLIENLTCQRASHMALEAVDLSVGPREIVALVGPQGAGKTTLLECVLGLHAIASGRVSIDGMPLHHGGAAMSAVLAHVPAQLTLPPAVRVIAHLRDTATRLQRRMPEAVLRSVLERGGVAADWHERRIIDCPPAIRRKLALAAATLHNAPVLLLDEPARDLDAHDTDELVASLRRIRKGGAAILLATRDLDFARRLATHIVVLHSGNIVEAFDPNASRVAHRADSYLAQLVG